MLDLLSDPMVTGTVVVATPEEMPVTETLALAAGEGSRRQEAHALALPLVVETSKWIRRRRTPRAPAIDAQRAAKGNGAGRAEALAIVDAACGKGACDSRTCRAEAHNELRDPRDLDDMVAGLVAGHRAGRAAIKAARNGKKPPKGVQFPGIEDGVAGMAFIEACVKSSKANAKWVKV